MRQTRNNLTFSGSVYQNFPAAQGTPCLEGMKHRWRYEEPHGTELITGTCQNCGESHVRYTAGDPSLPWFDSAGRYAS